MHHDGEDYLSGRYVTVGDVVAGKYLVERVLGTGGMAFVLSARHLELDEPYALKFLAPDLLHDELVTERFQREARAAARIRSEHVARVHDVGTHDGAPFMVMEHLTGRDMAAVLEKDGALPIEDAVEYTLQACEALAAAHALGIVHRDIKPENLFLVEQGGRRFVKLLDFGISKHALGGAESSRLTGQDSMGTPSYMSPEQIRSSASADAQADLWSLGVVLYELLTGEQAFAGETVTEVCAAVLEGVPCPIQLLRGEVPRELCDVVAKAMDRDRARRFASMADLAAALLPFASAHARVAAERSSSLSIPAAKPLAEPASAGGPSHTPMSWTPSRELAELGELSDVCEIAEFDLDVAGASPVKAVVRSSSRPASAPAGRGAWIFAAAMVVVACGVVAARAVLAGGGAVAMSSPGAALPVAAGAVVAEAEPSSAVVGAVGLAAAQAAATRAFRASGRAGDEPRFTSIRASERTAARGPSGAGATHKNDKTDKERSSGAAAAAPAPASGSAPTAQLPSASSSPSSSKSRIDLGY